MKVFKMKEEGELRKLLLFLSLLQYNFTRHGTHKKISNN